MSGPLAGFAAGFGEQSGAAGVSAGVGRRAAVVDGGRESRGWRSVGWERRSDRGPGGAVAGGGGVRRDARACSRRGRLVPLLGYLRGLGVVPAAVDGDAGDAGRGADRALLGVYLLERRGLSPSTVRNYVGVARVFLSWREVTAGTLALGELDGAAVIAFVLGESRRCSVGSAKCMVTRLRAFLRFLHVEGEIDRDLTGAVPSVASWRLAGLVKALDAGSLARLLASCDRRTRVGRRDFAVITLLSRLGLRAGEVAALRLSDIDWRCGRADDPRQGQPPGASAAARVMSARRSRAGWLADVRGASACSCSPGSALRWTASRLVGCRRSCSTPAGGRGCRWSALTACGTPPRPRCCAPAGA